MAIKFPPVFANPFCPRIPLHCGMFSLNVITWGLQGKYYMRSLFQIHLVDICKSLRLCLVEHCQHDVMVWLLWRHIAVLHTSVVFCMQPFNFVCPSQMNWWEIWLRNVESKSISKTSKLVVTFTVVSITSQTCSHFEIEIQTLTIQF